MIRYYNLSNQVSTGKARGRSDISLLIYMAIPELNWYAVGRMKCYEKEQSLYA